MRTYMNLFEIARLVSPIIQGLIDDYGGYQRSSLFRVLNKINLALVKWVKWKYKKKTQYTKRARARLGKLAKHHPGLFPHWKLAVPFPAELWELYDGRLSRTVLRAPWGGIPRGYSPVMQKRHDIEDH